MTLALKILTGDWMPPDLQFYYLFSLVVLVIATLALFIIERKDK